MKKGRFSFPSICKRPDDFYHNPPLDSKGADVPLTDPSCMTEKALKLWRDHLVDSFTEGIVGYDRPFRFVIKGRAPTLKVRMGVSDHTLPTGKRPKKSTTVAKTSKADKRRSKAKSRETISSSSEAESSEEEREPVQTTSKKRKRREPKHQDEDDYSPDEVSLEGEAVAPPRKSSRLLSQSPKKYLVEDPIPTHNKSKSGGTNIPRTLPGSREQLEAKAAKKGQESGTSAATVNRVRPKPAYKKASEESNEKEEVRAASATKASPQDSLARVDLEPVSGHRIFLQCKSMAASTLPKAWRKSGYNEKKVRCCGLKVKISKPWFANHGDETTIFKPQF